MELRHLRYFIAAAEEEHFGRASERLHVTRPAVSQIIADLEDELGTLLFERLPQHVKLTAAGRAFLPQLQAIMVELQEAVALTKRVGQGKCGSLNIAYGNLTLLHSLFKATIKRFSERYPEVALHLVELPSFQQPKALTDGRVQAGFMHFGPDPGLLTRRRADGLPPAEQTQLDWFPIQTGSLGAVVPRDHRLAGRASVTLAELADERFVVVPQSSSSPGYGAIYALCQKAGFEPNVIQEVSSITSQLNLVSVGMGIGLAVIGEHFAYPPSLAVVPLHGVDYTTNFVFGWSRGRTDPVLERMVQVVKEVAAELQAQPPDQRP
ncbi:LysR family transcriptional regulator [Xylophilus sp. GOD-11R]|uniref:LysR family transcriptional regulator n=1 Tax=Xylophilus sp. GOD-11R TaxID=3089814 RepID=UPI00298CF853|nr:LysR family transcriptional regulator [Xylophilus sp. GOD-11R]WPB55899.1 LysR family transcriptional regulator [Xylophilus sp. GOD-11R]